MSVQDGDVVGDADSAGDGLVSPPPPPPVPDSQPAVNKANKLSTIDKLTIFVFMTPLSPVLARMIICSLITIAHLLIFLNKQDRCGQILGLVHSLLGRSEKVISITNASIYLTCSLYSKRSRLF